MGHVSFHIARTRVLPLHGWHSDLSLSATAQSNRRRSVVCQCLRGRVLQGWASKILFSRDELFYVRRHLPWGLSPLAFIIRQVFMLLQTCARLWSVAVFPEYHRTRALWEHIFVARYVGFTIAYPLPVFRHLPCSLGCEGVWLVVHYYQMQSRKIWSTKVQSLPMFIANKISQRFADFGTRQIGWIAEGREDDRFGFIGEL